MGNLFAMRYVVHTGFHMLMTRRKITETEDALWVVAWEKLQGARGEQERLGGTICARRQLTAGKGNQGKRFKGRDK